MLLVEAEKRRHTHQVDLSKHLEGVLESRALDPILGVAVMMFLVNWVLAAQLGWVQSSPSKGSFVKLVHQSVSSQMGLVLVQTSPSKGSFL